MNEKVYKTMGTSGAASIVVGIVILVAGIAAGVIAIVNGARLINNRKELTF